jgi:hypothetical protein
MPLRAFEGPPLDVMDRDQPRGGKPKYDDLGETLFQTVG